MTLTFPVILIIAVFVSQILVLSFICPARMYRAWLATREKYPPQEFLRLYPVSPERVARQTRMLHVLHIIIGIGGAIALVLGIFLARNAYQLAMVMFAVYVVQILPPLLRLPMQLRLLKAFRAMPAPAVRTAELRTWRVLEFLSPVWIALGLMAATLAIACSAYFYLQDPSRGLPLHALGFAINAWLLGRMLYKLFGPGTMTRPDPYMSAEDLLRVRRMRMRMPFYGGILMGIYFTFMELYAARLLQFDYVYVAAGASLLGQLLYLRVTHVTLRTLAMRDLTPYRAEVPEQA